MTYLNKYSFFTLSLFTFLSLLLFTDISNAATKIDPIVFPDKPLKERLVHPDWFNLSFLDLPDDLAEANKKNKGLIIFYSQGFCPYCKAFIKNNWEQKDIIAYTRKNFDVIAIDVLGMQSLTGFDNKKYTEREYAIAQKTNFTPSLVFYDNQGKKALKFNGYRPPYQFRAALEYVADSHHRKESFKTYLSRAESAMNFGNDQLNTHDFFEKPPYDLTQKLEKHQQYSLVIYERKKCHSCDVLHAGPLTSKNINTLLKNFKIIQLDMKSNTPVTTHLGYKFTARSWADKLNLNYAPTLLFYDKKGKEIIRVDSVVGFFRLQGILEYVTSKAYLKYPTFQQWRQRFSNITK
ncbi:MAG: thioredoxin family protein [Gammaproteobacteria bacterium]